jgi:hypothetical protein
VVISFFDFIEESRNLSTVELNLRRLIIKILQRTIKERMAFWKQRSKIKFAIEGDENSKYFHAIASARYRKNKISTIEINGSEFTDHHLKMQILTAFYQQLLGQPFCPTWNFPLEQLYTSPLPNLQSLALPFSETKITQAFFQMNSNASPEPDGFGPGFFKKNWQTVKLKIFQTFNQFYHQTADLTSINRAYLFLIPKKEAARTPSDFRPISLQNCPIKAIAKVLANRLQNHIPNLIHGDQTGFVRGRSISENFSYAGLPIELLS